MVRKENVNCVVAEWKNGAKTRYAQAANNARVVAAQVAFMITFLMVNIAVHLNIITHFWHQRSHFLWKCSDQNQKRVNLINPFSKKRLFPLLTWVTQAHILVPWVLNRLNVYTSDFLLQKSQNQCCPADPHFQSVAAPVEVKSSKVQIHIISLKYKFRLSILSLGIYFLRWLLSSTLYNFTYLFVFFTPYILKWVKSRKLFSPIWNCINCLLSGPFYCLLIDNVLCHAGPFYADRWQVPHYRTQPGRSRCRGCWEQNPGSGKDLRWTW